MARRAIVITGAGGGLGGTTARLFADRGWHVYAADLRPPEPHDGITALRLDVTDTASVSQLAERVGVEQADGLHAVVNFAGVMLVGALVELDESELRRILDINVLGTYRVNKALFESVLRAPGRIVNISSEVGTQRALMLNGPYAMSKHAVEAYSDALRRELMFVGVPVITIRPGPFRTDMVGGIPAAFERAQQASTHFATLVRRVGAAAAKEEARAHDPKLLAETVWTAVTTARPRSAYAVATDRRRALLDRLPASAADVLLRRGLRAGRASAGGTARPRH